jgi:hypothetical protein
LAERVKNGIKEKSMKEEADKQGGRHDDIEVNGDESETEAARGLDAGKRKVKKVQDPKLPSAQEVREHS